MFSEYIFCAQNYYFLIFPANFETDIFCNLKLFVAPRLWLWPV